ncbi:hypothetical protein CERSUDRAFT_70771 [Gelatoporia subvermispora B]|uniref:DUF6533 domain-containing protein n=1 Tax=Ceriporiopsis subvermispora (strain B) TaxID=914234 RepID=M2R7I2_CERS8|nr:hypothetical protein CERSUDRAFT_70771 [Gelatoporia subvermispora B]
MSNSDPDPAAIAVNILQSNCHFIQTAAQHTSCTTKVSVHIPGMPQIDLLGLNMLSIDGRVTDNWLLEMPDICGFSLDLRDTVCVMDADESTGAHQMHIDVNNFHCFPNGTGGLRGGGRVGGLVRMHFDIVQSVFYGADSSETWSSMDEDLFLKYAAVHPGPLCILNPIGQVQASPGKVAVIRIADNGRFVHTCIAFGTLQFTEYFSRGSRSTPLRDRPYVRTRNNAGCSYLNLARVRDTAVFSRETVRAIQLCAKLLSRGIQQVLAIYDYLIALNREIDLIWGRKLNSVTLIFHLNRWTTILFMVVNILSQFLSYEQYPMRLSRTICREQLLIVTRRSPRLSCITWSSCPILSDIGDALPTALTFLWQLSQQSVFLQSAWVTGTLPSSLYKYTTTYWVVADLLFFGDTCFGNSTLSNAKNIR